MINLFNLFIVITTVWHEQWLFSTPWVLVVSQSSCNTFIRTFILFSRDLSIGASWRWARIRCFAIVWLVCFFDALFLITLFYTTIIAVHTDYITCSITRAAFPKATVSKCCSQVVIGAVQSSLVRRKCDENDRVHMIQTSIRSRTCRNQTSFSC